MGRSGSRLLLVLEGVLEVGLILHGGSVEGGPAG